MAVNAIAPVIPTSCNQLNVQAGDLLSPKGGQQTLVVAVHSHPLMQTQSTWRYFSSASQRGCIPLSFVIIATTLQVRVRCTSVGDAMSLAFFWASLALISMDVNSKQYGNFRRVAFNLHAPYPPCRERRKFLSCNLLSG